MASRTFKVTDPEAKKFEDIRLANKRKGEPLPDKPVDAKPEKAKE